MSKEAHSPEPDDLSVSEKILRVQDLWDEIARTPDAVEVTESQLREAERRLADHRENPTDLESWEDVRRRLERER